MTQAGDAPTPLTARRRHPARDIIELLLSVLVLYLVIRHFACEIFKIPSGSMAPTLLGQHRDLRCPNCGLEFPVDGGDNEAGLPKAPEAVCPNCGYAFSREEVANTFCTCFPAWPPALFRHGDNRVIVDKFMWDFSADAIARGFYRRPIPRTFSPPKRWDVFVFRVPVADIRCRNCGYAMDHVRVDDNELRCPMCGSTNIQTDIQFERRTYIKRLIGLPGETIEISHGDICVNGKIAPRPAEVQDAAWQFVYDSAHVPTKQLLPDPAWKSAEGDFKDEGGILRLIPGNAGIAEVRYGRPIEEGSIYSGMRGGRPVGELRWDVQVKLDGPGVLRLKITEDDSTFIGAVRFGTAAAKTSLRTSTQGAVPTECNFSADPAKPHRVVFFYAAGVLQLAVDGRAILSREPPLRPTPEFLASSAALQVESARAEFSRVRLDRNIYYLPPPPGGGYAKDISGRDLYGPRSTFIVPEHEYFALGDNVRNSLDSRYWGAVPERNLIGRAAVVWWPLGILRAIH